MKCETIRPLLSARLDGELDPREAARVQDHVGSCPTCADEARALAATADELAELCREIQAEAPAAPRRALRRRSLALRIAAAVAAAALLAVSAKVYFDHLAERRARARVVEQAVQEAFPNDEALVEAAFTVGGESWRVLWDAPRTFGFVAQRSDAPADWDAERPFVGIDSQGMYRLRHASAQPEPLGDETLPPTDRAFAPLPAVLSRLRDFPAAWSAGIPQRDEGRLRIDVAAAGDVPSGVHRIAVVLDPATMALVRVEVEVAGRLTTTVHASPFERPTLGNGARQPSPLEQRLVELLEGRQPSGLPEEALQRLRSLGYCSGCASCDRTSQLGYVK